MQYYFEAHSYSCELDCNLMSGSFDFIKHFFLLQSKSLYTHEYLKPVSKSSLKIFKVELLSLITRRMNKEDLT